jgi:hypothetical protein
MIGRGHPAGPCPALSYVERGLPVFIFIFLFFYKKIKKIK